MTSKRTADKTSSIPSALAVGIGSGIAVMLIGIAVGAWAVVQEWIKEDTITIVSIVITVLGAALAAIVSTAVAGKRKLQISLLSGLILFLILLACNAMFFDGQYSGVGRSVIAILATSSAAVLLLVREGRTEKKRTAKRAYR